MKVMLACPNVNSVTCGIGQYTVEFAQTLKMLGVDTIVYGGPLVGLYDRVLESNPDFVHIQFEYGFASPQRLHILARQLEKLGKKLILTFHSVSNTPHNEIALRSNVRIIVHQKALVGRFLPHYINDDNVLAIPLAITSVEPSSTAITIPKEKEITRIGWFGNVFFHKGLHLLLRADYRTPTELLLIGSKGEHSIKYYEMCKDLAEEPLSSNLKRVLWYDRWMANNEIVAHLRTCDFIAFPYSEYGGVGCSAALRLAFNAERPCYVSNVSHFCDVLHELPFSSACALGYEPGAPLYVTADKHTNRTLVKNSNRLRVAWSFPAIVQRHLEEVYL